MNRISDIDGFGASYLLVAAIGAIRAMPCVFRITG
jgi:hypothetical protein